MAKKILLIEDQPEMVKLIKTRLKANGYDVVTAGDGVEGVEKVKTQKPDLVITDLALPKMTGNVVVRVIKKTEELKHIPVIMLSAFVRGNEKDSLEVPADDYMAKPFDAAMLLEMIKKWIH